MTEIEVIAEAIAPGRVAHGQWCPVWTRHEPFSACDCWIKQNCVVKAEAAVKALRAAGMLR
jgi:hypothetical protein